MNNRIPAASKFIGWDELLTTTHPKLAIWRDYCKPDLEVKEQSIGETSLYVFIGTPHHKEQTKQGGLWAIAYPDQQSVPRAFAYPSQVLP